MVMAEEKTKKETEEKVETDAAGETSETPVPPEAPVPPVEDAGKEVKTGEKTSGTGEKTTAKPDKPAEPDWKDLYARLLADFDNYKKRASREREDTYRYAETDILKDVLATVDNLQLALDNAKDRADDDFVKGVKLVYDSLLATLKDHGAEPFDSVGKTLDTERMEAIATLPSEEIEEGLVSIESKRGWMLKGKVLRAAQVVVSAGKPAGTGNGELGTGNGHG